MMLTLLLKDLRAFGRSLLKVTVLCLIVITLFVFLNEGSWFIYIVMAAGQISFVIGYYLMSEKMHRGDWCFNFGNGIAALAVDDSFNQVV